MATRLQVSPYSPGNEKPGYYGPPTPGTETAPFPAPGVPNPNAPQTGPGNGSPTTTPGGSENPRPISAGIGRNSGPGHSVKSALLRPALTSHFQLWIFPPPSVISTSRTYKNNEEFFSLSCMEASLPGSSLLTNEINDDYTGVTERFSYRKQYDNTTDFTFLVDAGAIGSGYNVIRFFEEWIRYTMGEEKEDFADGYFYRARFPDGERGYRADKVILNKFERDYNGAYLQYTFVKAYPISISSMPVSYESSQLLKCTVSFTYNRYVLNEIGYSETNYGLGPIPGTPPGVPNPPITTNRGDQINVPLPPVTTDGRIIPPFPGTVSTIA